MKILYLITKSEIGGAGVHVLDLCLGMQSKGHKVALMCPEGDWLDSEFCKKNNNFYKNEYFANTINPFKLVKACILISKAIKDFGPDIIACHSSVAGILGRFVAMFYKKPKVIFTAHSWAFTEGSPLFRKILMVPIEKFLAKFTDKIICVSEFDKNIALKYKISNENKIIVIYNGVKDLEIRSLNKKEIFRIITVTRLDYPKLPELLIRAFSLIDSLNMELVIVGYGSQLQYLNSLINKSSLEKKIKVLDKLKKEEVVIELYKSDMFVLVSKHEGLPITILEAMSIGLPVIASNVGGIKEEIDENCGYLINNNIEEIKEAILKVKSNEDKLIFMSKNSWNKQRNFFSLEKFIEETEKVYIKVI